MTTPSISPRAAEHRPVELSGGHYSAPRAELLPLVPSSATRVLDVGCGAGGFGRSLLAVRPAVELWGVEANPEAAALAAADYQRVVVGLFPDASPELPTQYFDLICFNDVLEHMLDPQSAVGAATAHLARGGSLFASIPNVRHFSVLWPLLTRGRWDYADDGLLDRTHVHFFTRATMVELFERSGWRIDRVVGINRSRWPEAGKDTWKTRLASVVTRGRSDDFFFTQYVLQATPAS